MQAIVISAYGGPDRLRPMDVPEPEPGPGQILIDVTAAGVNFMDVYQRTGSRHGGRLPFTPGTEAAGTVVAVGEGVTGSRPGDVVVSADVHGSYARRALVDADRAVTVPDGVSASEAASVLLQGLTAHYLLSAVHPVRAGDTVLVHAAAGGTGSLLTQIAKLKAARVIGTASSPEKVELARRAGADEVVGYADFASAVRRLTGGTGVDVLYDGVGAATFEGSLASLRPRGVLALYGAASGPVPPVDPMSLNSAGSVFLTRPSLAHHIATREELTGRAAELFEWVRTGLVRPHVGTVFGLADARRAHEELQFRRSTGKLLLVP